MDLYRIYKIFHWVYLSHIYEKWLLTYADHFLPTQTITCTAGFIVYKISSTYLHIQFLTTL